VLLLLVSLSALLLCALLVVACAGVGGGADAADPPGGTEGADGTDGTGTLVRFLSIEGDVERSVIKNGGTPVGNDAALPGDEDFEGVPLVDFVAEAGVSGTPRTLYLVSSGDGFVSSIDYADAGQVYVVLSSTKGWSLVAPNHPPGASGMDIDHIIVVSEGSEVGLSVVHRDGSTTLISTGQLLTAPQRVEFRFDGRSVNEAADGEHAVSLYTRQYSVALADVDEDYAGLPFVVVTADGGTYLTSGEGRFVPYRQTIDYVEATGDVYEDVVEIRLR
jgi:hypothetical protein